MANENNNNKMDKCTSAHIPTIFLKRKSGLNKIIKMFWLVMEQLRFCFCFAIFCVESAEKHYLGCRTLSFQSFFFFFVVFVATLMYVSNRIYVVG